MVKSGGAESIVKSSKRLWQSLRMLREETLEQSSLYTYESGIYASLARVDQAEGGAQKPYYFHTDQSARRWR